MGFARSTCFALITLAAGAAIVRAEAPPPSWWSFDVPAGWVDNSADFAGMRDQISSQVAAADGTADGLWVYASPDDAAQVIVYATRIGGARGGTVQNALAAYERGVRSSMKGMAEIRYASREDGNSVSVDHLATGPDGAPLMMRRIHGVGAGHKFLSVVAMCSGAEVTCSAALLGLRADSAQLLAPATSLGSGGGTIDTESSAYKAGSAVGTAFGIGLICVLIQRHRKRKAAAA